MKKHSEIHEKSSPQGLSRGEVTEAGRQCSLSGGAFAIIKAGLESHAVQERPVISPPSTKSPFPSLVPWQSWLCLGAARITLPPAHQSPLQKVRRQSGGGLSTTVLNWPLLHGVWKGDATALPPRLSPQRRSSLQLRPESGRTPTLQVRCPRKSKIRLTAMFRHRIALPLNM